MAALEPELSKLMPGRVSRVDNDRLTYALYFRGEDETDWKLLRANIFENTLLLDGDILADGRYYFRVVASDRPSNAPEVARDDQLISAPVLIDNTPPVVTLSAPRRTEGHVELMQVERLLQPLSLPHIGVQL